MMIPPGDGADNMRLTEAAKLPAQEGGRIMPLDSVARNSLMAISGGAQSFVDAKGDSQPAIKWLIDCMVATKGKGDQAAITHKVFRIENFQVLALLRLEKSKDIATPWRRSCPTLANWSGNSTAPTKSSRHRETSSKRKL